MSFFQDDTGGIHFLSDEDVAAGGLALLPLGCTEVTEEQASAALAPSLAVLKAAASDAVDVAWLAANQSTFEFAGHSIQADQVSRSNIDGTASYVALWNALPPDFPGFWKAADNTHIPMTDIATFKAMVAAMVATGIANFAHAQERKAAIQAATTKAALAAISW